MPLYDLKCLNGHHDVAYYHDYRDRRTHTYVCVECRNTMAQVIQRPGKYTYFSEKTPRVLYNLGHDPVEVRSHWEHQKLLKERELGWITPKRGMPGSWA